MESNERTTFQKQKESLISDIALVSDGLEQVINNINVLNKNLEGVIAIGKDFENVASLWKNFNSAIVKSASDEDLNDE
ncbi:34099_t:CDS:2, partial [Racocetra persica]